MEEWLESVGMSKIAMIYWGKATINNRGTETFPEPIQIYGFYTGKDNVVIDNGIQVGTSTVVQTAYPIENNGYIMLGEIKDYDEYDIKHKKPTEYGDQANRIMQVFKEPSILLEDFSILYKGYLK